jgi:hypothetical protein
VIETSGPVTISQPTVWKDAHYKIHGDLVLAKGGTLEAENCTIELMNTYARQYRYLWQGGTLVTNNCTIGGTRTEKFIAHCNLNVRDGQWLATDTTIRFCYGVQFDGKTVGRIVGTRLKAGPHPDAIIMSGKGDVTLTDSQFPIALTVFADKEPGSTVLDMPVDTPITRTYDGSNLPGAEYSLKMVNSSAKSWFLFVRKISMKGPPTEIAFRDCPKILPAIMGNDLTGTVNLPTIKGGLLSEPVRIGNVTFKTLDRPVGITGWGLYLKGEKTNLKVTGPTRIAELMLSEGSVELVGTEGTYDAVTSASTIEVGKKGEQGFQLMNADPGQPSGTTSIAGENARLLIRNAEVGDPYRNNRGQITAHGKGKVEIINSKLNNLLLMTKGAGAIDLRQVEKVGTVTTRPDGGAIRFLDAATTQMDSRGE